MEQVELLTVEDCFQIGPLAVLRPNFSVPPGGLAALSAKVRIVKPDGESFETDAEFNMSHFRITDPNVSIDERWRIVVSLLRVTKDQVPVGSKILASSQIRDALLGKTSA